MLTDDEAGRVKLTRVAIGVGKVKCWCYPLLSFALLHTLTPTEISCEVSFCSAV